MFLYSSPKAVGSAIRWQKSRILSRTVPWYERTAASLKACDIIRRFRACTLLSTAVARFLEVSY